jgi:hypothetical protein
MQTVQGDHDLHRLESQCGLVSCPYYFVLSGKGRNHIADNSLGFKSLSD